MSKDTVDQVVHAKGLLESKLIPTLPTHKRHCTEEGCGAWTFPLSWFDKYHGELNNFPTYMRTMKYKCENDHVTETVKLVDYKKKPL